MTEVRTTKDLDLGGHEAGYMWVAGELPARGPVSEAYLVRKYEDCWVVIRRSETGMEYVIQPFRPNDSGEGAAKHMATMLVDAAWAGVRN